MCLFAPSTHDLDSLSCNLCVITNIVLHFLIVHVSIISLIQCFVFVHHLTFLQLTVVAPRRAPALASNRRSLAFLGDDPLSLNYFVPCFRSRTNFQLVFVVNICNSFNLRPPPRVARPALAGSSAFIGVPRRWPLLVHQLASTFVCISHCCSSPAPAPALASNWCKSAFIGCCFLFLVVGPNKPGS